MIPNAKSESRGGFDAVAESRKWKEAVASETAGMTATERMTYFRSHSSVVAIAARARNSDDASCVVREEPAKPGAPPPNS